MITLNGVSGIASSTYANNLTFGHTVNAGDNKILLIHVAWSVNRSITSMKFNGVDMTLAVSNTTDGYAQTAIYYLVNPPVGTYNVAMTSNLSTYFRACATVFNSVHQTVMFGTGTSAYVSGGVANSINVSSAIGDVVVDAIGNYTPNQTITAGSGQTAVSGGTLIPLGLSYKEASSPTTSMSWTWASAANSSIVGIALKPDVAPSGSVFPGVGGLFLGRTGGLIR